MPKERQEERLKTDEGGKEERWKVLKQRAEIMDSHYEAEDRKGGWYNQSMDNMKSPTILGQIRSIINGLYS